jgi:thioredoxin 1|tara:strand:- start:28 stop:357 length:330 start_codon:yes stop_codon:yes gene_type:complete
MSGPVDVTDSTWEEAVMNSELPILVDFWAEWCGPCKMIAPAVHDLAEEYAGKLNVAKVDIDNSPEIATKYGIRSIPALIFFKDGKPVDQVIGALPKGALKKKIDSVLGS